MPGRVQPLAYDASSIARLPDEAFAQSSSRGCTWKTLFCASRTPTDTFTSGIAVCAPKTGELALHRHPSAELYHFIQGSGIVEIDGTEHCVKAGSVIYIPGSASHRVKNTSETKELKWLYVFAVDRFASVQYQWDNDKPRSKL